MSSSNIEYAIQVEKLSKCFTIYNKPIDRLKQSIVPRLLHTLGFPLRDYYQEFWALQDLSLDVRKGETVGILGRNGSGKSTLLQMICGTLNPTSGSIITKGRITALLELGSGFNPEFTGRENIYLNGAILGLPQEEIRARFDDIVNFSGIGDFIDQPVKFYSSGMVVRLAFSVQAMVDPDILVVDEALAVGDELFQRKCFRRLSELKESGTSILFVSHAASQIVEICDRALFLESGRRVLMADPVTAVRAYHKFIYASPEMQPAIIQELMEVDQTREITQLQKENLDKPIDGNLSEMSSVSEAKEEVDVEFLEAGLVSQSTEVYPILGGEIRSVKIYNSDGKEVNNLLARKEYELEIQGSFHEERESVYFMLSIGRLSGPAIFSLKYPVSGKHIDRVYPGQKFRLVQKIRTDLTASTYFVTVSINSSSDPMFLHKIVDAVVFRVLPKAENWAFGYVDLTVGAPELKISDISGGHPM